MGKRIEKAFGRDKGQSVASQDQDDDPNKTPEPYLCTGHFAADFSELCRRDGVHIVPNVVTRPKRPPSPSMAPAPDEKPKGGKKDDKKNQPPPEPEPELELDANGEPLEPPPKTYTTKEKFDYFKPCIQVEQEHPDKMDTVTEIYIRGWKIDEPMMTIFKQCWPKLDKLHTINLWNTGLTDETLDMLASFLPECPNVRNLVLDNNPVKGENYSQFLKEESPVVFLSLRYNNITEKGAKLLGDALYNSTANIKLLHLNLNGNKVGDKGAEHLARGLRMNRTLLCLGLANNQVGNAGASKLAEVVSRFSLTHEEIVQRRTLLSEKGSPDRNKSPGPGSRRADSRDRPGSRNSHAGTTKGGRSAKKKDTKGGKEEEKHDKSKGKKEQDKSQKKERGSLTRASLVPETKGATKKGDKGTKKGKGGTAPAELEARDEPAETPEMMNPLLDTHNVEKLPDGVIMLTGNRTLINLNLAYNNIDEDGVKSLGLAIGYQTSLAQYDSHQRPGTMGLMRLILNKNKVPANSEPLQKLQALMLTKDPFYKPPPTSPDQESQQSK